MIIKNQHRKKKWKENALSKMIFDSLQYVQKLKMAGVSPQAAEAQAETQTEIVKALQTEIANYWADKQTATRLDCEALKLEIEKLRTDIQKSHHDNKIFLLKWCLFMLFVLVGMVLLALSIEQQ